MTVAADFKIKIVKGLARVSGTIISNELSYYDWTSPLRRTRLEIRLQSKGHVGPMLVIESSCSGKLQVQRAPRYISTANFVVGSRAICTHARPPVKPRLRCTAYLLTDCSSVCDTISRAHVQRNLKIHFFPILYTPFLPHFPVFHFLLQFKNDLESIKFYSNYSSLVYHNCQAQSANV